MTEQQFKVGDKVCLPLKNLNGEVTRVYKLNGVSCFRVQHGETFSSYWEDGKDRMNDAFPSVYHGHMEEGSGKITFTPKKEPVYEWQWQYIYTNKHGVNVGNTGHFKCEADMLKCHAGGHRTDFIRIERSKRVCQS